MRLALTAALAFATQLPAAQQGVSTWQFVTTADFSTPQRRHECGGTQVAGDFLLLGGRGFRVVDRYDPLANVWTKGDFAPLEIHHFQPVERNGLVWIIGAFTGPFPNETPLPEIRLYDPNTDTWSVGPTIPASRRRGSAGVVLYEDDFYVLGGNTLGHNGGFVPWFDRYDPDTDTWTPLPDAPHARDHFSAVVIGNKLYAAAGRQSQLPQVQANTLPIVDVFDFESGQWSTVGAPIPTERAGVVTVGFGEHLVVAGGESATQAHAEVEALDVLTHEWVALPDLIQGRHGAAGALLGSELHVTAGVPNLGGSPELNTHERIDLAAVLAPSPDNLLQNPEFDGSVAGWSGGALAGDGSIAPGSLEVVGASVSQTASAGDLQTYRLRGVYQLSGPGSGTARLEALDLGSGILGTTALALTAAADWRSFSLDLTAPSGTVDLRVAFEAAAGTTVRVDDLGLVEKPSELPYFGIPANAFALRPTGDGGTLGTSWLPSVDHTTFAPGSVFDALLVSGFPTQLPLFGDLLLITLTPSFSFAAIPPAPFVVPIPNDPGLVGNVLYAQAASTDGLQFELTNAIELTISTP